MPTKPDGLRRLPDHVVGPLLRALMTLPAPRHSRLVLKPTDHERAPTWRMSDDYDVMFSGRLIGTILRRDSGDEAERGTPWFWQLQSTPESPGDSGHVPTLADATKLFRAAWELRRGRQAG